MVVRYRWKPVFEIIWEKRKVYNHFLNVSHSFAFFRGNSNYNDLHICCGKNRFALSQPLAGPSASGKFGARVRK